MKKLLYAAGAVLGLLMLVLLAGSWYVRTAEPSYDGDAILAGLGAPVEVWHDSLGVPHVWARSEEDLFRAVGFLHARDRLWQMEFLRRVADGRLAEALGPELVDADRFLRSLGMGRAAMEDERRIDEESRRLFQAYAEGVNSWIHNRTGSLPPEFIALQLKPEPWTVRNSLSISKLMAWDLADWQIGLDLQRAVDRVGPDRARLLLPAYPDWGPRIVQGAERSSGSEAQREPVALGLQLPRIPVEAAAALEAASMARASNSWVIGGTHTRSGKPILANDPHLALRAPSLWYLAALHGGGISAAGVTIPGTPLVVLGRTERVAWGFTNVMLDDVDFFVEQIHPDDPRRYRTPAGWEAFEVRPETIRVKGAAPVVHPVRRTRHGPVLSDVEPRSGGQTLSMRWTALQPSRTPRALLGMNRARSAAELLEALRLFDDPHQNVVFADADGRFGYQMVGRIPVRRSGDGLLPVPGWTDEGAWTRFADFEQHPRLIDPAEGFVVTANNAPVGPDYPVHLGSNYADPFRAMRIREMIQGRSGFRAEDVARQQMDVVDLLARRYLGVAIDAARAAGDSAAVRSLREWKGEATQDSHAAALFYLWYEGLRRRVGEDEFGGGEVFFPRYAMNRVLDGEGAEWVDDVRTPGRETLPELSEQAMRDAIGTVGEQTWGDLHQVQMSHALGAARHVERIFQLNVGPFPSPGSPFTVNVAGYGSEPPFTTTHGASMRHVADLGDADGAGGFILPTGQSGLPFSRHYQDQTTAWREGRLWRIPLDRGLAADRAVQRMTLRPE